MRQRSPIGICASAGRYEYEGFRPAGWTRLRDRVGQGEGARAVASAFSEAVENANAVV
jgi:hypothetical protein